jgi:hypothetical protein
MIDARVLERSAIVFACSRRSPPLVRAAVVALCAGWALGSGCAARPATWRSVADQRWLELRSEAFIMATDLPRLTALERFRELEDAHHTVVDHLALVSARPRPRVEPFRIVHLARCSDLARTSQRTVAASVTEARDFSGTRLVVTCDDTRERRSAFIHEMIHALTAAHFTRLPPWLFEGLAAYYQTLRIEDSSIVIGLPPRGHLISDRLRYSGFPDSMQRRRYSGAPNLETLMSMTEDFYKGAVYYNYVGAWKFVHLLNSPPHRARFVAYLRSLLAGASPDDAWSAAFGDIDSDRIAAQYANYTKRMQIPRYRVVRRARAAFREPVVQNLLPGEVHALWIQLYLAGKSASDSVVRQAVREHLAAAAREDPRWTGATFWRAVQAYHGDDAGNRVQTERLLRSHAAREPRDVRAWAGLVTIGSSAPFPPPTSVLVARSPLAWPPWSRTSASCFAPPARPMLSTWSAGITPCAG